MRRSKRRKGALERLEDLETHYVILQTAETVLYSVIRQRWESKEWWVFIGFRSESQVEKVFAALKSRTNKQNWEQLTYPILRVGSRTGEQQDDLLLLFVRKTVIKFGDVQKLLKRQGSRDKIQVPRIAQRDFFSLSHGYHVSLIRTFEHLITHRKEVDN